VPDLVVRERLDFPIVSLACQREKKGRFVERVETFDQKVGSAVNSTLKILMLVLTSGKVPVNVFISGGCLFQNIDQN
jgi:hypothetical protein